MPRGHTHDNTHASANTGNTLGDRSSVRQSKLYRQYESGNDVKDILGTGHLQWRTDRKQGVYDGHDLYDHNDPYNERSANQEMSPKRLVTHKENTGVRRGNTFSESYNKAQQKASAAKKQRWEEAALRNEEEGASESIGNLSPSRAQARQEQFDENAEYEVDWDVQTGRQKLKKTGRMLPPGSGGSGSSGDSGARRGGGGRGGGPAAASHKLTANERMRLREQKFAASASGHKRSGNGVPQGSPYSAEEVFGPGGESAMMADIDNMDPDSLERLAAGLSELKVMADEARRLEKLDRLKKELHDLGDYVSPQSSPARAQAQAQANAPSFPSLSPTRSNSERGQGSPLRGILKSSNSPTEDSLGREAAARQRLRGREAEPQPPQRQQQNEYARRALRRTDTSSFYDNSHETGDQSHSHSTYGQHQVSARQQQPSRALKRTDTGNFYNDSHAEDGGGSHSHRTYTHSHQHEPPAPPQAPPSSRRTDASKFYDNSYDADKGSQSHSHRTYTHSQQQPPSALSQAQQPLQTSRRPHETDARNFFDNTHASASDNYRSRTSNGDDGSVAARERERERLEPMSSHARVKLRQEALSSNRISPAEALRQSAPFALDPDVADEEARAPARSHHDHQGDAAPPITHRTARTEATRSTKFW